MLGKGWEMSSTGLRCFRMGFDAIRGHAHHLGHRQPSRKAHVFSRYAVHGIRPTTELIQTTLKQSATSLPWQHALVQALDASKLQVPVPVDVGCQILRRAVSQPSDPMYKDAIVELSESMLFAGPAPAVLSSNKRKRAEKEPLRHEDYTALSGWSHDQVATLIQGLVHFNLHDRAMLVAEHFALRGWQPTSHAIAAILRGCAWEMGKRGLASGDPKAAVGLCMDVVDAAKVPKDAHIYCGLIELLLRPAIMKSQNVRQATSELHASILDYMFATLGEAPSEVIGDPIVAQKVVHVCLQLKHADKALQFIGAMRTKGYTVPTACFNELLRSLDSSNVDNSLTYLRMMDELRVRPDERTLIALIRLYFLRHPEGPVDDPADVIAQLSSSLDVALSSSVVSFAAFHCLRRKDVKGYESLLQLMQTIPRPVGAGPPKWLIRVSSLTK